MTGSRDWDKEMAEIDKLMAADRPAPPSAPAPSAGSAAPVARAAAPSQAARAIPSSGPVSRRRDTIGVWSMGVLGMVGAVALWYWPYAKVCGPMLYGYLIGVAAITGAGLVTMRSSWTHRRGVAHVVGLLTLLAGLAFVAAEVLPRTGYAAESRTWTCP